MRFIYKHKEYEVMELHDIANTCSFGMVALFEIQYCHYDESGSRVLDSEEDFLNQEELGLLIHEEVKYINYFYLDSSDPHDIIEHCEYFIDHQYDKDMDECKYLMKKVRLAQLEFDKDVENGYSTKGSLDALEYAQSDLYDYIAKNIKLDEILYQVIFHSGSFQDVDFETYSYEQAQEVMMELTQQIRANGDHDSYYEIKEIMR